MLCSEYTLLSSLLSTAIELNTVYNGTLTVLGSPAAVHGENGVGVMNITLPYELARTSFLWNRTYDNGTVVETNGAFTELNTTLRDHVFRLSLTLPSDIIFEFDWGNANIHSAIIPVNTSSNTVVQQTLATALTRSNESTWFLDFRVNNSNSVEEESITMSFSYTWRFRYRRPGYYEERIVATLTPFDWGYKEMDVDPWSQSKNRTKNSPLGVELGLRYDIPLANVTFEDVCGYNQTMERRGNGTPFDLIERHGGALNCSRCIHPNQQYAIRGIIWIKVIQYGADLHCTTSRLSGQGTVSAGELVSFNVVVEHHDWSTENASHVEVELKIGEHAVLSSLTLVTPTDNSTIFSGSPSSPPLIVRHHPIQSEITINANATFKDSLPLQNEPVNINAIVKWTSPSAGGEVFLSSCSLQYRSDSVTISTSDSYMNIPSKWSVGETAQAVAAFKVPAGTLRDVSLELEFNYDDSQMSVELVGSDITKSNPSVILTKTPEDSYPIKLVRSRRAVGVYRHSVNVGNIVNPSGSSSPAGITILAKFRPALSSRPLAAVSARAALLYASTRTILGSSSTITQLPVLEISKRTKYGSEDRRSIMVELTINHTTASIGPAYNIIAATSETGFEVVQSSQSITSQGPGWSSSAITGVNYNGIGGIEMKMAKFNRSAGPVVVTFEAKSRTADSFPAGNHTNRATLLYHRAPVGDISGVTLSASSCTLRHDIESDTFIYQHGITAAAVIVGFIAGIILIPVIVCVVMIVLKKHGRFGTSVQPSATDYRSISQQKRSNDLLLDTGQKLKQGFNSAMVAVDDSIVSLLALRDRFTTHRELDNLDIQTTVEVDKRMEAERLRALDGLLDSLLLSMVKNRDITRPQYERAAQQSQKASKDLEVRLTAEYSVAIVEFTQRQATYNRRKLGALLDKQRAEKAAQLEKVSELSDTDRKELVTSIDAQCQIEQDDLSYRLKLEQDEEAERLRKEFSLKKRIQTKEIQQTLIKDMQAKTDMPEETASWLLKEHAHNVANLEKMHDDELCRQKLVLEEKLAKRRALAELSDTQEKAQSELLNTIAGGQMDVLKKAKKQKILTADEARNMSNEIMNDLVTYKQSMEVDMGKQEQALHKRLSELKKKQLVTKQKEHENELAAFEKRCRQEQQQQQLEGSLNPLDIAEERLQLVAKHEIDRASAEIQIDQQNATELRELREQMNQVYKGKLVERERKLLNDLKSDGLRDEQIEAITAEHNSTIETLELRQQQQYQQQDEKLKMRLKKRRRDWEKKMEQEQKEKAQLRDQEATLVKQIIDNQFTMSTEERDKIMREHEQNMIRLENSLTLNKLRQRQILEQKLADRRAKRMEELEQEQLTATKKTAKRHVHDDEEDKQVATLDLLKSQAEERVAALTEEDSETNFDEELEAVKMEIMQQRAVTLREQEDHLGSMVAQLQINKAKELTEIDEKQKAINELKANLIDDLNDRGVMSDIEAEQCLETHRAQQEKLTRKLNTERDKQEKMLKKKLAGRLEAREKTLLDGYEDRLKEAHENAPNKVAAKLKRAAVLHKRAVAVEEFKTRIEKEFSQSLEEMRREHTIKKAKLIQELELRFIASLVKQGKLKRSVLKDSLKILFPTKSEKQLENLINDLHDDTVKVQDDEQDLLNSSSASMLKERIARSVAMYQNDTLGAIDEEPGILQPKNPRPKSTKQKRNMLPSSGLDYALGGAGLNGKQKLPPLRPLSTKRLRAQANSEDF